MLYLTYNDSPSGIYFSQVTDVCKFLNFKFNAKIRLVAFISFRDFFVNRRKIKFEFPDSMVVPMFPKIRFWKFNIPVLLLMVFFLNEKKIIARGPFAAGLCLILKRMNFIDKIIFDARGAYAAEFNEYNVTDILKIKKNIFQIESNAVLGSDFRLAVSDSLVNYWKEKFKYKKNDHVVIPCTLNSKYFTFLPEKKRIDEKRKLFGFSEEDIVIIYSGSTAGWQSLDLVDDFLCQQLKSDSRIKILFLLKSLPENMNVIKEFRNRIICQWLREEEVSETLPIGDYGILIREKSITNKVASPVKFAEYLSCGLKIVISSEIGDYSEFVAGNNCGYVLSEFSESLSLTKVNYEEKLRLNKLALDSFSKNSYSEKFGRILKI